MSSDKVVRIKITMKFSDKILFFIVAFIWLFAMMRFSGIIPEEILKENKENIVWLYSSIGLIFGMVSAFVIQSQWAKWDKLDNSARGEVDGLREMILLSKRFPQKTGDRIRSAVETYLNCLINKEGWKQMDKGERTADVESAIETLQNEIFMATDEVPKLTDITFRTFTVILEHKNKRLHLSAGHLPYILNITITFSTFLFIALSMLIYVPNGVLDFIFKFGVAFMSFLVYIVIFDLDHPYKPGSWHLTKDDYKKLLDEIQ